MKWEIFKTEIMPTKRAFWQTFLIEGEWTLFGGKVITCLGKVFGARHCITLFGFLLLVFNQKMEEKSTSGPSHHHMCALIMKTA